MPTYATSVLGRLPGTAGEAAESSWRRVGRQLGPAVQACPPSAALRTVVYGGWIGGCHHACMHRVNWGVRGEA